MAITAGRASNNTTQTVADGVWTNILVGTCEEIAIACAAASAAGVRICVVQKAGNGDSVHRRGVAVADTPDDWAEIAAGGSIVFAGSIDNKITAVYVAGDGGTATITWTVTKS